MSSSETQGESRIQLPLSPSLAKAVGNVRIELTRVSDSMHADTRLDALEDLAIAARELLTALDRL